MSSLFPFLLGRTPAGEADAALAADLRRLAEQVENGAVSVVLVTAIRKDGSIEHLGEGCENGCRLAGG